MDDEAARSWPETPLKYHPLGFPTDPVPPPLERNRMQRKSDPWWKEPALVVKDIANASFIAFALPAIALGILFAIVLLIGCQFVTEGSYSVSESSSSGDIETIAANARCGVEVECSTPEEDEGTGAGGHSGGSESEDDANDEEFPQEESSSDDESSTGEPSTVLYGPCDETCEFTPVDFFDGCLCTAQCITDEDCPDGVCNTEFYWCVQLCGDGQFDGCQEGQQCQIHDGLEIEFCVWPFEE